MKPLSILLLQRKLKFNVLANAAGFSWLALVQIALIPVYIAFMGIESYGLLGFYVTMQAILQVFDLGLTPTLNREIARLSISPEGDSGTRSFVRTIEYIYWPIGILMAISILAAAPYISSHWIHAKMLSEETVREAILLMSGLMLIQWPLALYLGGLMGTQKQVLVNGLQIGFSIFSDGGAILVLWLVSPTITAFLEWQIVAGLIRLLCLRKVLWGCLPAAGDAVRFNRGDLKRVRHFALGMSGIALTAVILTQFDRVVLSRLLSLEQFGYYMIAATAANGLLIIVNPVFSAVFPRFSSLAAAGNTDRVKKLYHLSTQLMAILVIPPGVMLCIFSRELLLFWTGNSELAVNAGAILCFLVIGRVLNGLMHIPYALQLAYGWTALGFRINIFLIILFVPGVVWMANQYGGVGAAATWAAINAIYMLVGIPLTHRRLLPGEASKWFMEGLLSPIVISLGVIWAGWRVLPFYDFSPTGCVYACLIVMAAITCSCLGAPEARRWASGELAKIRRALV
jgi:O-antigen/teichoic acid export membrane protein